VTLDNTASLLERSISDQTSRLGLEAFQCDPSWYEVYWYADRPATCRVPIISCLASGLRRMASKLAMLRRALADLPPEGGSTLSIHKPSAHPLLQEQHG
jgi:hypothetical protein